MSHTTHWAFDKGIFTISDQYEIVIHSVATSAIHRNFGLLNLASRQIKLPADESYLPHEEALLWHKEEVFGRFHRS